MSERRVDSSFLLGDTHALRRVQSLALIVGGIGIAASALGAFVSTEQFLRSYLVAYLYWFGIGMGAMSILMIYHISGGAWGAVIRRPLESATRTLPLMAVLFLPVAFGVGSLYEWADPHHLEHDAVLQHKAVYLNVPFFLARAAFYFVVWLLFVTFLNRWSMEQDRTASPRATFKLEQLSRGGLVAVGLTMTFAAIDWVMSLEPHWFSTIYGVLVLGGQVLTAMAFMIAVTASLAKEGPMSRVIGKDQFHDLGKFLLAFVMVWAYFSFSQFLIIWSANLPEEIPWYLKRFRGGWEYVGIAIVVFHFVLPFVVLLSREMKRNYGRLMVVALAVLVARGIDLFWLVTPAFHPGQFVIHWLDVATIAGVGGIWVWYFVSQLAGRPLLAVHDPSLPEHA